MQKAYSSLKTSNPSLPETDLQPTHHYMRFLPSTEEEWGLLKSDTSLVFYDFPLNYEMINLGTYYHDPTLPETAITWQYCVVPVNHSIPNVPHELLYEVYIPEEENTMAKSLSTISQIAADLEYASVQLTGSAPEGLLPSKWTPQGTIKVWDADAPVTTYTQVFDHWEYYDCNGIPQQQLATQLMVQYPPAEQCTRAVYRTEATTTRGGYIPLVGASVHARWFTRVKRCLTNSNGYFQTAQFRFEVNDAIKWERADFDIRSGNWWQAWFNGPKQRGDWNLNIERGGMSWIYAHIHRGANTYYYENTYGIKTPPKDGKLFKQRIHIGALDKSGINHYYDFNKYWLCPQIKIFAYTDAGSWKSGERIFGTTVHELAHASHWEIGYTYGQYVLDAIFSEPFLPESWALGVESVITSIVYSNDWEKRQDYTLSQILGNGGYTPIVWDLMDNYNQRLVKGYSYPIDKVYGYTLTQLENALYGHFTWTDWRNAIRDNYNNPTKYYVNELFANYK